MVHHQAYPLTFASHAKINLGLHVLGKRADGYHEIETIFQEISLKDEIDIVLTEGGISLECDPAVCAENSDNLAYRAAQLLQQRANIAGGCHIAIRKRIPIGAGLGGGSSNAATTLKALNHLWKLRLTAESLESFGASLGSDVPFFIKGGTAIGAGRGEKLTPICIPLEYWGLLVCPPFSVSTKWAYQAANFSLTKTAKSSKFFRFLEDLNDIGNWKKFLPNDLETVVFSCYPTLRTIVDKLYELGAFYARMSGSGSSLLGLFLSLEEAQKAELAFRNTAKVFVFRPVVTH